MRNFFSIAREVLPTMKEKDDAKQLEKFKEDLFLSYCHRGANDNTSDTSTVVAQIDRSRTLRRNIFSAGCGDVKSGDEV